MTAAYTCTCGALIAYGIPHDCALPERGEFAEAPHAHTAVDLPGARPSPRSGSASKLGGERSPAARPDTERAMMTPRPDPRRLSPPMIRGGGA